MKMLITICDRCGKQLPDRSKVGYVAVNWRQTYAGDFEMSNPYEKWDLCEDCMKKITLLIDGTIDVDLEPAPLPEEEGTAVEALTEAMKKTMQEPDEEAEDDDQDPDEEDPEEEDEDAEDPDEEAEDISRMAGNPPPGQRVNLRELRELVKQGKTAKEIADHFGISVATYYKHRKKAERLYITGNL